jgi:glycosyltransferase involved in cell wall biosynthesis
LGTNLPENALIVLGVGDFSAGSNKRLDWIINEVDRTDLGNNVHLVLAGQASFADIQRVTKLCQKLGDRVHLRPNTSPDSMRTLYQVADVMVHAALREPFGIVLLESMACGVPVIGHSGHSVTGWIIGNGGCTVDMTVSGELSATLRTWNDNPKLRFDFGMAARERVLEHFSPAIITPLYRQFYSVVNSG